MKAILSNFGRRVDINRQHEPKDAAYNLKSATTSTSANGLHFHQSYSSFGTTGGGIGDAPTDHRAIINLDISSSQGYSNFSSSSPRSSPSARASAEKSNLNEQFSHGSTSATRAPAHPPSSYRHPSRHDGGAQTGSRGLVRKLSSSSGRASLQSTSSTSAQSEHPSKASKDRANLRGVTTRSRNGATSYATPPTPLPSSDRDLNHSVANADISIMTSSELAQRLNELAVANADGLLSEDEYRTLRQAVFDKMMMTDKQALAIPTDSGRTGYGLSNQEQSRNAAPADRIPGGTVFLSADLLSADAERSKSSLGHHASSIRSGRSAKSSSFQNVTNFFRGNSSNSKAMHPQTSQDSHSSQDRAAPSLRDSEGASSQHSSGDGNSRRALSFRTQHSSAARSSSRMSTLGRLRAGSHARREQAEYATRELEDTFSAQRTARSLRAVSIYDAGSTDLSKSGVAVHNRSPTSLRAEIAPTTMFGAEYVDKTTQEIRAEIGVVQTEGNRMLETFAALEDALLAKQTSLDALSVSNVLERVRAANPLACATGLDDADRHGKGARHQRPPPPSSYRMPRSADTANGSNNHISVEASVSEDVAVLHAKLTSIYTQKAAVVKRYQDRLAFLASKLRSATIREGLK
ncbi:hypothetical protein PHSY_003364 [Pseudozyma hubeiensis SY62]|uniref:Uncharacterized protein n=1 Tax=Pseudozyma hubeiensis (strain SY62) TaxID=1305764 RepID=R9P2Y5_PSEHS|nr:hypothetical protein PHSY_003364 [Pseudozyma hubeiensis SY62]GAC95788.1 hypothetical protein PHSY_003364 [Pseudozyma hubeiensis SY62]